MKSSVEVEPSPLCHNELCGTVVVVIGTIPTELSWPNVQRIILEDNMLTGTVSKETCKGPSIEFLFRVFVDCDEVVCNCCGCNNRSGVHNVTNVTAA